MSGFVCVVSLGNGPVRVREEAQALADTYVGLRGGVTADVGAAEHEARGAGVSARVEADGPGWSMLVGAVHGDVRTPVRTSEVASLDGQFCLASHDASTRRTVIATDRFGAAPVYVCERDGLLYVSTSAMVLARHLRPAASVAGLRNFLVSGYQFGAETHWEGVRRLEPGSVVEVVDGEVREHTYWRASVDPEVDALGLDAAVEYVMEMMVALLRERLAAGSTWVDLTGGYDSRLLALLLERAGVPFEANTRESWIDPDIEVAGTIAALKGWPWRPIHYPRDWPTRLPGLVHRALTAADGRLEVLQLSRLVWSHAQLAETTPRLLSSGGGEHLQSYPWRIQLPGTRRRPGNIERWVDMVALHRSDMDVLAPGARAATRDEYTERLTEWTRPYRDEPATRQLDACYAYQSGNGHFGAYRAADDVLLTAQLPYYYAQVYSAAFSLRERHRNGYRLVREMMYRLDPDVAAVTTTMGGPALPMRPTTVHRYLPYYAGFTHRGANKVAGALTGRTLLPERHTYPWPEQESNAAVVVDLLSSGVLDWDRLRVRPLLSAAGLDRLRAGNVGPRMLGRVLTAEMALATTGTGL